MCVSYPLDWKLWTLWGEVDLHHRKHFASCRLLFSAAAEALDIGEAQLQRLQRAGMQRPGAFWRLRASRVRLHTAWGLAEWSARNHTAARRLWGQAEVKLPPSKLSRDDVRAAGAEALFQTWSRCEGESKNFDRSLELAERAHSKYPDSTALWLQLIKVRPVRGRCAV